MRTLFYRPLLYFITILSVCNTGPLSVFFSTKASLSMFPAGFYQGLQSTASKLHPARWIVDWLITDFTSCTEIFPSGFYSFLPSMFFEITVPASGFLSSLLLYTCLY
jgi:hypothetical protein